MSLFAVLGAPGLVGSSSGSLVSGQHPSGSEPGRPSPERLANQNGLHLLVYMAISSVQASSSIPASAAFVPTLMPLFIQSFLILLSRLLSSLEMLLALSCMF